MRPIALLLASFLALPLTAQAPPIERGRALLRRDDPDHAAVLFREAIAQAPDSAEAHYWLGVAYGRQARKANVIRQVRLAMKTREEFERAVELDPNDLQARFALVEFYTLAPMVFGGGDRKAFQQATEIAARDPAMGHEALAFIYADTTQNPFQEMALGAKAASNDAGNVDLTEVGPSGINGPTEVTPVVGDEGAVVSHPSRLTTRWVA